MNERERWVEPIIEEPHQIREEHAAKFNYDSRALFEDWLGVQEEMRAQGWKFVEAPAKAEVEPVAP